MDSVSNGDLKIAKELADSLRQARAEALSLRELFPGHAFVVEDLAERLRIALHSNGYSEDGLPIRGAKI